MRWARSSHGTRPSAAKSVTSEEDWAGREAISHLANPVALLLLAEALVEGVEGGNGVAPQPRQDVLGGGMVLALLVRRGVVVQDEVTDQLLEQFDGLGRLLLTMDDELLAPDLQVLDVLSHRVLTTDLVPR